MNGWQVHWHVTWLYQWLQKANAFICYIDYKYKTSSLFIDMRKRTIKVSTIKLERELCQVWERVSFITIWRYKSRKMRWSLMGRPINGRARIITALTRLYPLLDEFDLIQLYAWFSRDYPNWNPIIDEFETSYWPFYLFLFYSLFE